MSDPSMTVLPWKVVTWERFGLNLLTTIITAIIITVIMLVIMVIYNQLGLVEYENSQYGNSYNISKGSILVLVTAFIVYLGTSSFSLGVYEHLRGCKLNNE